MHDGRELAVDISEVFAAEIDIAFRHVESGVAEEGLEVKGAAAVAQEGYGKGVSEFVG